jgi:hypothetical protein
LVARTGRADRDTSKQTVTRTVSSIGVLPETLEHHKRVVKLERSAPSEVWASGQQSESNSVAFGLPVIREGMLQSRSSSL